MLSFFNTLKDYTGLLASPSASEVSDPGVSTNFSDESVPNDTTLPCYASMEAAASASAALNPNPLHATCYDLRQDIDIWQTIQYVHQTFLSQTYSNDIEPTTGRTYYELCNDDWSLQISGRGEYGVTQLPRPNHGLAHTLRGAFLLPTVAQSYQRYFQGEPVQQANMQSITMNPNILKKLQVCLLFSVVGRKNELGFSDNPEVYETFRQASADAFERYASTHLNHLFSFDELSEYKALVKDFGNPDFHDERAILMRQCHNLDLPRCYSDDEIRDKIIYGEDYNQHALGKDLGAYNAKVLLSYSCDLISACGDRIMGYGHKQGYDHCHFFDVSVNPTALMQVLLSVERPRFDKKMCAEEHTISTTTNVKKSKI